MCEAQELETTIEIEAGTVSGMDERKTATLDEIMAIGTSIEPETETAVTITQRATVGTPTETAIDIVIGLVRGPTPNVETWIAQPGILLVLRIEIASTASVTAQEALTAGTGRSLVISRATVAAAPAPLVAHQVQVGVLVMQEPVIVTALMTVAEGVLATRWMLMQTMKMKMKRQKWPVSWVSLH